MTELILQPSVPILSAEAELAQWQRAQDRKTQLLRHYRLMRRHLRGALHQQQAAVRAGDAPRAYEIHLNVLCWSAAVSALRIEFAALEADLPHKEGL